MNQKNKKSNRPGAHFSIAKGLEKAIYTASFYRADSLQIFTKNATTWKERVIDDNEVKKFETAKKETGITAIASHTSYLINPAAHEPDKYKKSCNALKHEIKRSSKLGIDWIVLHPGSHRGKGEKWGISRVAQALNTVLEQTAELSTMILLETTAGQGHGLGHTFEQLSQIIEKIDSSERIGICLDTCHIFAAGYDIRTEKAYIETINKFNSVLGLEKLLFIHLNDSKKELGSKIDRHENIGMGYIGLKAFEILMQDPAMADIPKVIEIPGKGKNQEDMYKINLNLLQSLMV